MSRQFRTPFERRDTYLDRISQRVLLVGPYSNQVLSSNHFHFRNISADNGNIVQESRTTDSQIKEIDLTA